MDSLSAGGGRGANATRLAVAKSHARATGRHGAETSDSCSAPTARPSRARATTNNLGVGRSKAALALHFTGSTSRGYYFMNSDTWRAYERSRRQSLIPMTDLTLRIHDQRQGAAGHAAAQLQAQT
jgi:hypothetical protein